MSKSDELFERITAEMIAAIESGTGEWRMPWHAIAEQGQPVSIDGRAYRGMNHYILSMTAAANGWTSGLWGTFKAWQKRALDDPEGGLDDMGLPRKLPIMVKGTKGTTVTLWKPYDKVRKDDPDKVVGRGLFCTTFTVFAAEQLITENLRMPAPAPKPTPAETIAEAERYFAAVGANVKVGGNRAFYAPADDYIAVPTREQFRRPADFYSTLAHEHGHWTGHASRIDRDLSGKFGSDKYAAEELVAELTAAFWCASQGGIGMAKRDDHAAYLSSWLRVLRADPKALVTVMSKAQGALDYLDKLAGAAIADDEIAEAA